MNMTVKELKNELRKRGAPLCGKKADLIERLTAYEINNNFTIDVATESVQPNFEVPPDISFRDINANTVLPQLTRPYIDQFLKMYSTDTERGEAMYQNKFLAFCRYSKQDNTHYFKGMVHAQMFKNVTYNVHVKVTTEGFIGASHCDCAAGSGGSAHCKHVVVLLLGVEEMVREGKCVSRQACTQQLQTFHKPKKKYQGTPLKSASLQHNATSTSSQFDPRPSEYRKLNINDRIHNLCSPYCSTMPLKHLFPPANPYAIDWDHNYSKVDRKSEFLESIYLLNISEEDITRIELETRGQSENPRWHDYRRYRVTASHFFDCCSVQSEDASRALVKRLLNPKKIYTEALIHGTVNERIAIKAFMQQFEGNLKEEECGLFIMKKYPYLGASPDRLLAELTVIEVKCPYVVRHQLINPITVPYLYFDAKGELRLKSDHEYMYQVQGQLAVTGRTFCDFIVFTFCDMKVISIEKDESFIANMLTQLERFYNCYFLPALLNKLYYRRYDEFDF